MSHARRTAPKRRAGPHASSLRSKILLVATGAGTVILAGLLVLILVSLHVRSELEEATEAFLEEQRIANGITHSVMRQLVAASALPGGSTEEFFREFDRAGQEVYRGIRNYLFRDLSTEERLLVEAMGEEHQRLEVAAARTANLLGRGLDEEAELAREATLEHVLGLLDSMGTFMAMREGNLAVLQARQARSFGLIYLLGGALGLVVLAGGALLSWAFHERISVPLSILAEASERMGSGDLSVRVPQGKDREFQVLSDGFNRMAESLERTARDLERRNQELSSALDTLRETQHELVQSEKLRALGRMAAGLAHELNNPLASVVGFGQLLRDQLEGGTPASLDEVREEYVLPILGEAERAHRLVRRFLQFSRQASPELGGVALRNVVETVADLNRPTFSGLGLELEVDQVPDCWVQSEPEMLKGVLTNLVSNARDALKPQGSGTLRIAGRVREDEVDLVFEDDGPGMEEADRVFEPFFTTKPTGEGTGLGLALVHGFTTLFGGRVTAANRPEGGARFTLTLKRVAAAPPPEPDRDEEAAPRSDGSGPEPSGSARPSPRILVVEDEEPLRRLQERLLERLDATVYLAPDASSARRIMSEREIDAVVSDVKMPGQSGLELYRWIQRERPELAHRFVFVTGDVGGAELTELARETPDLFIRKPFDVEEYVARVRALLD